MNAPSKPFLKRASGSSLTSFVATFALAFGFALTLTLDLTWDIFPAAAFLAAGFLFVVLLAFVFAFAAG